MCQPDARFYVAVNPHFEADTKNGRQWFLNGPIYIDGKTLQSSYLCMFSS